MKFVMMISIVAIGTLTADAQYFKGQGRVYARQDIARDYLISKYIETKWIYATPLSRANVESPVVNKKLRGYYFSQLQSSIVKANKHYREKTLAGNVSCSFRSPLRIPCMNRGICQTETSVVTN